MIESRLEYHIEKQLSMYIWVLGKLMSNLKKNFTKASLKAINTNIFISEGSVTTKGILHLYTGNYWKESDLCQVLNQTIRHIFALRLLFVIVFEHFVFGVCKMIDFGVPDIPESLDIKVGNAMF